MREVTIHNLSRKDFAPFTAGYCSSFLCRLRGLTFQKQLPPNWGLLLVQERENRLDASIHMLFMQLDLGVVWIDSQDRVVDTRLARRWKLSYIPKNPARYVLEISVERLNEFSVGDQLKIEKTA
ncbi:MAG: DUF192 domain-containing protein [Anaerolineales bacterium]|nr:DUF192 domain-containing protein [Anaerolineales bacterium]